MYSGLKNSPYYDDYDPSDQFTQLVAVPGRVAQAREFTQMQTVLKDIIKNIGDSIMKDGNIIEGCQIVPYTDANGVRKVRITKGKMYMGGMVLPVDEIDNIILADHQTTTYLIRAKLYEEIKESNTKTVNGQIVDTLKDPAQGYANYNLSGCVRLKSSIVIEAVDASTAAATSGDAVTLATIVNGDVEVENQAPEYDVLTETLARRTNDESGSYIVNGMQTRLEGNTDSTKFNVVVESGKAYIRGYEIERKSPKRIEIERPTSYISETIDRFNFDQNDIILDSRGPYVKQINSVIGTSQISITNIDGPSVNNTSQDLVLPDGHSGRITEIVSVTSGSTTYTKGTDYELETSEQDNPKIKWKGVRAPVNESYTAVVNYMKTYTAGTDYELSYTTGVSNGVSYERHILHWKTGGGKPISNAVVYVSLDRYLARKDLVYIDQYGNIEVSQGVSASYGKEVAPSLPTNALALAYIYCPPGGYVEYITGLVNSSLLRISISNVGLTRFTMRDVSSLLDRIKTLEYNQAVTSLNDDAKSTTINNKKGIWTDALLNLSKISYTYNRASNGGAENTSLPLHSTSIDLVNNVLSLATSSRVHDLTVDTLTHTGTIKGKSLTLRETGESKTLSQMKATKPMTINPYSVFPENPEIALDPSVDNWIQESTIQVNDSRVEQEVVSTSSKYVTVVTQKDTTKRRLAGSLASTSTGVSTSYNTISNEIETYEDLTLLSEQLVTYMRSREVIIEGLKFASLQDDIKGYFDDQQVTLTAMSPSTAGTDPGTIKASALGQVKAKFTIPQNILSGNRTVKLVAINDGRTVVATAIYQSTGIIRTYQHTTTTVTRILQNRVDTTTTYNTVYRYYDPDPLAQTFYLERMTAIKGINLYFQSKPNNDVPVTCEIRGVTDGSINSNVYGSKTLYPGSVNISDTSATATRFNFDEAVILEGDKEYAIVVRSASNSYKVWISEMGENDVQTGEAVLSNSYLLGVMMSSSNNRSWTVHQTSDLKFELYSPIYSNTATFYTGGIDTSNSNTADDFDFSMIYFSADSVIPQGTDIKWYYSTDYITNSNNPTWYSLSLDTLTSLSALADKFKVKVELSKNSSSNLSPVIYSDSLVTSLSSYEKPNSSNSYEGYYVGKSISSLDDYKTVTVIVDYYNNAANNVANPLQVYVRTSSANHTLTSLTNTKTSNLDNYWQEKVFTHTIANSGTSTFCQLFLKLDTSNSLYSPLISRIRMIMSA